MLLLLLLLLRFEVDDDDDGSIVSIYFDLQTLGAKKKTTTKQNY
jgi:hypothetical protein